MNEDSWGLSLSHSSFTLQYAEFAILSLASRNRIWRYQGQYSYPYLVSKAYPVLLERCGTTVNNTMSYPYAYPQKYGVSDSHFSCNSTNADCHNKVRTHTRTLKWYGWGCGLILSKVYVFLVTNFTSFVIYFSMHKQFTVYNLHRLTSLKYSKSQNNKLLSLKGKVIHLNKLFAPSACMCVLVKLN